MHARSSHVYHPDNHALIKNIIRAAHPVEDDVREQAHAARTFAYKLTKSEQRLDVVTEGYYDLGLNDITPDGRIETASFIRLLKRALKSTIQAHRSARRLWRRT